MAGISESMCGGGGGGGDTLFPAVRPGLLSRPLDPAWSHLYPGPPPPLVAPVITAIPLITELSCADSSGTETRPGPALRVAGIREIRPAWTPGSKVRTADWAGTA